MRIRSTSFRDSALAIQAILPVLHRPYSFPNRAEASPSVASPFSSGEATDGEACVNHAQGRDPIEDPLLSRIKEQIGRSLGHVP